MRAELAMCYGQERLPCYTSYPTAPQFSPAVNENSYRNWLDSVGPRRSASLYLHVPFCRSMCWYCGCHTSVTQRHEPIAVYAAALRCEAQLVADTLRHRAPVTHIHFGGGTPTIMSPELFVDLVGALRQSYFRRPGGRNRRRDRSPNLERADDAGIGLLRRHSRQSRRSELRSEGAARHQSRSELRTNGDRCAPTPPGRGMRD